MVTSTPTVRVSPKLSEFCVGAVEPLETYVIVYETGVHDAENMYRVDVTVV